MGYTHLFKKASCKAPHRRREPLNKFGLCSYGPVNTMETLDHRKWLRPTRLYKIPRHKSMLTKIPRQRESVGNKTLLRNFKHLFRRS